MPDVLRDYDLDDLVDADTPERLKALGDRLRRRILDLVLEQAMSVSELARRVDRPKGTVAYHVDVLVDAGLLKVVRTRRVRAIDERYYGRVARTIILPGTPGQLPFLPDVLADADLDRRTDTTPGFATYRRARIPAERVAEYIRRLDELSNEFVDEPRAGDTEFGFYVAVFPTTRGADRLVDPGDDS
jgi:DNA-binding transcriptional ArsR family regulator